MWVQGRNLDEMLAQRHPVPSPLDANGEWVRQGIENEVRRVTSEEDMSRRREGLPLRPSEGTAG